MDGLKNILYKNDHSNTISIRTEITSQPGNTPLLDQNQSTTPLNHNEDDKHSFILEGVYGRLSQNVSTIQHNQSIDPIPSTSYGELNHIKGAEQRKKLFTQFRNSDISDQNKQDDEQQEIHSPSLTSNSFIFKPHEEHDGKPEFKTIKSPHNLRTSLRKKTNPAQEKTDEQQQQQSQQQLAIKSTSNTKVSSLSQLEQKQSTTAKRYQGQNGSNMGENIQQTNSWIGSSIPNISQKQMQGIMQGGMFEGGKESNAHSAANTFSDMSMNMNLNSIMKGQLVDDRDVYHVKSSLSNALNESQQRVQFEDASIIRNHRDYSVQQSDSALVSNVILNNNKNPNQGGLNFKIEEIKTLDVLHQPNQREARRGSNFLEIPSPTQQGGTSNLTSYQRKNSDKSQVSQRTQNKAKKRNFLKAFYFTYKFLQKMRFVRKYKNIYMLEKKHFKLIKDNAFGGLYERLGQKNLFTKFITNLTYFLFDLKSPFHAFQPTSFPLLIFEFSILLILLFLVFYIPIKVCFSSVQGFEESNSISKFLTAVPYILLLEIFINLNTAYFSQGSTVNDRKSIIKRYLGFKFWIDVLTIVCLNQSNIIPLIFILRIYQVFKILYDFDESFQIQFKFPTTFELTKLCLIILFVAHICACGFHLILDYQSSTVESWVSKSNVNHKSWQEIYVAALYFSFTTMITVGFGDIVPYSLLERVYVIVMQLVSCGVFAYAINTIGGIFQEIARKSAEYRQQKQEIIDYMMRRRISKQTQIKVLKYLEYIHSSSEAGHKKGYEILNLLSKRLKDVVYKEYYGRILMQFKLFNRKFSEKFLKTLSLYMREQTLGPGEILYNEGELDQRLFYVQSGEIEQYADLQENGHKDIVYQTLKQGDYFGQYAFLGNQKSKNSARSLNVSQIVYCTLEDFTYVIRQFPNDFETYCSLKDSINFSDEKVDVLCSGCSRYNHQVQNCPLLHYEMDKEAHIRRYIHSDPQKRDENFSRNKPYFQKWASKYQSNMSNRDHIPPPSFVKGKREKNYQYQRFNVYKEYYDLRVALRQLRLKLSDPEEKNLTEEQLQKIYQETDDRKFILETKVPIYQTIQMHKQKNILKHGRYGDDDDDYMDEDEDDLYEEEFADYEDIMNNDHSQVTNPIHNNLQQQSFQRMSTLSSQIHVPTEKSLYLKMPSEHNFKASGNNSKVLEESSEDYEDEEDDKKRTSRNSSNRYLERNNLGYQVSFKDENERNPPRKMSNSHYQKGMNMVNNMELSQMTEEENHQQKSLFYRGIDQSQIGVQPSPTRYMNRHKTLNPSSFNNLTLNFETYLRGSTPENNPSSMGSIVLQQQGSKRKGTVLSSIGQGSSKLRQQGSQDFSINIQRTGTLNSKGLIRNSNPALSSKKLSDKNVLSRSNTGKISKIDSKSKVLKESSTQFAKFANTLKDNYSEKINRNPNGSQYSKQESNVIFKIMDFDKQCEFAHYLPWNNLSVIMKTLKKIQKVKQDFILGFGKSVKTFKTSRTTKFNNTLVAQYQNTSKRGLNDTLAYISQPPTNNINNNNNNSNSNNIFGGSVLNNNTLLMSVNNNNNNNNTNNNIINNSNINMNNPQVGSNLVSSDKAVITVNIPDSFSPTSTNFKNEKKSPPINFKID